LTILLEGLNRIRDLIDSDIDKGQLGTGTAASTESDTGLGNALSTSLLTTVSSTAEKQISFTYTMPSTTQLTATVTEFELQKSSTPVNYDRIVFTGLSFVPDGGEDIVIAKRYFIRSV